ncbi:hypothetical protein ACJRO7_029707 [Eucalyptus globulus]|uniref:Protein kinase domain-containing protein n=1 Tax=Eucalyptus globulus TaxID=34317 RepID=A0ABD3JEZ1_EUCGL
MMSRVCFVLPGDQSGEICVRPPKEGLEKRRRRDCGGHVLGLIRQQLRRLHGSRCAVKFCHHQEEEEDGSGGDWEEKLEKQRSGVFFDMEGVQLADKVGKDNPRIFSYSELYIGSNGFSEDEVLGSGGFGRVYRAVLPSDGTVVAVKCVVEKGERFEKTFEAELVAVAHLRHRNLVRLRGWCVHEDQLLLVYDYMPNRSLDRILFHRAAESPAPPPLGWERRREIVRGLAAALHYLHEQLETQIIHRDVKTSNVMLDSQFNARLGDFGLARWLEHELEYRAEAAPPPSTKIHSRFHLAETTRIGGTIGYLPPESFQRRSAATSKSDVFSFGIVVLEVASGRRAVHLACPDDRIVLLDWVRHLSDEGMLLKAGDSRLSDGSHRLSDMEGMIHLGLLCTLHDPQLRPSMKWVVEALSGDVPGKLPALPSFRSCPLYISLASPAGTSMSNTTTELGQSATTSTAATATTSGTAFSASHYVTADAETIYATAERGETNSDADNPSSANGGGRPRVNGFFSVETPREISYKELVAATDNFSDKRRVAELDFGTAYRGFLDNRQHILVKRLGMNKCPALRARFSNELHNLGRLRHRSLVQLRGWCTEQGEMLVVYDYSTNCLLSHLLFHHNDPRRGHPVLRWRHRYNIIRSLASAILYLHEDWDEQVIHRNITSSAVIIDPDMNPRLSCFALAEFLTRNDHGHHAAHNADRSVRGIFGYMSPEYMESGEATTMMDIYSFGVVILEVVTGYMAVDFRRPEVFLVRRICELEAQMKTIEELADMRLNGEYDLGELKRLVKLGIACTRSDPGSRPSIRQIVSILDGNDRCFIQCQSESLNEWSQRNATSLSMIRSMQSLGIQ